MTSTARPPAIEDAAAFKTFLDDLVTPVMAELDRFLPDREPADYLYAAVAEYPRRDAKGLRPAILIASCEAHGGSRDAALLPAVSIELLHNALLIHDDIQDGSDLRRGEPALHHLIGDALAINAGDALAMFALRPLDESVTRLGTRVGRLVMDEFHRMTSYALEGQALELGWTRDNVTDLGDDDYLRLIMLKTCWYTTVYPLRVGAIVGSRGHAELDPLIEFGYYLGAAFQIRDDLLNLDGDVAQYGKEQLGDLFEGKRTLPLLHLLRVADQETRRRAVAVLDLPRAERQLDDVVWMRNEMERWGSIAYTRAFATGIAGSAHQAFLDAFGSLRPSAAKSWLEDLIAYMLDRND